MPVDDMENSRNEMSCTRLYIGGISPQLAENIEELEDRLSRYGNIKSSIELHRKPTIDNFFGFVDIEILPEKLADVKRTLSGFKFMNSRLAINVSDKGFKERWKEDAERPDLLAEDRIKRNKIALARQERIENRNVFIREGVLVKGRLRKTPRKNLKNLTFKVEINGRIKIFKCQKKKLWGVDKNRKIRDLTFKFVNNQWRDGNDHVIESLELKNNLQKILLGGDIVEAKNLELSLDDTENNEEELAEEKKRNNKILENLFSQFDFEKPVAVEDIDAKESSGESEYEYEAVYNSDDQDKNETDSYGVPEKSCTSNNLLEDFLKSNPMNPEKKPFDEQEEEEDDDDDEIYKQVESDHEKVEENLKKAVQDTDEEFIPTFTKSIEKTDIEENQTEKLRSLLNPAASEKTSSSFKLSVDSDIEEENDMNYESHNNNNGSVTATLLSSKELKEIQKVQNDAKLSLLTSVKKSTHGLFFAHFDSPFLVAQSQLSKLDVGSTHSTENYDEWFYENRGALNREFKRKRRDVLRQYKKKIVIHQI
ncbi:hypothetical protein PACTADRAFT_49036 [Pachysolen tannophilus NRRL Y-2460]|uniref:RRM domain-containing protein n=1 Tax=Pachysolen tannophilus NRRL Y-2460 TaxID=669874 RepID=A0A1E4TZV7_PACTA|nr:hypothetical protein PACTADRAFT_49036 [Pachysolen tannophilus NRRL Y-2460]